MKSLVWVRPNIAAGQERRRKVGSAQASQVFSFLLLHLPPPGSCWSTFLAYLSTFLNSFMSETKNPKWASSFPGNYLATMKGLPQSQDHSAHTKSAISLFLLFLSSLVSATVQWLALQGEPINTLTTLHAADHEINSISRSHLSNKCMTLT